MFEKDLTSLSINGTAPVNCCFPSPLPTTTPRLIFLHSCHFALQEENSSLSLLAKIV